MSKTYVVPDEIACANSLEAKLEHLNNIQRSFSVYRVDVGSCNGCEIEIFAAITPMWDPERFGFKLVANPRHADILLCTGPVTRQMYYPLLRAYEAMPDPKIVVALGACGSSGGIFHDAYGTWGGIDKVIPVDVYIPGCPPHPAGIIYGLATALGILDQKVNYIENKDGEDNLELISESIFGNILFERDVMAKAKVLMGYLLARKLFDKYINGVKQSLDIKNVVLTKVALEKAFDEEFDERYVECMKIIHNEVYLTHMLYYGKILEEYKFD
ncbi:NADH-quinone oxidoreductase subunit B family protein [Arcobacter arenosus]|uniref:NADH-quinone oxidoreductase subunit NuoB n=1 Tax=Arcobacter arenosus TaxID=2576037 RepID=A0A5R8XX84_9BACT|nr:NADH-quinone oxidoreductase subunit B family protein [Arcobacter arenosus]TLP35555.1 NADH-quinone oxidoreductase subunit NuoB [Arcobacter arenosus]